MYIYYHYYTNTVLFQWIIAACKINIIILDFAW